MLNVLAALSHLVYFIEMSIFCKGACIFLNVFILSEVLVII